MVIKKDATTKKGATSRPPRFSKKVIPSLKYGVLHAQFGHVDGVSIVMQQVEEVMVRELGIPKGNIFYLTGRSKKRSSNITVRKELWIDEPANQLMLKRFNQGYGGDFSQRVELAITHAQSLIEEFAKKHGIDVFIAHNTSHPVNFVFAVALHRFYRDRLAKGVKTPKYILWWHDAHTERPSFSKPAPDVLQYLLQGVPGQFVEYVVFINSLQFHGAYHYFEQVDQLRPGFLPMIQQNHSVVYNTTNTFVDSYEDLLGDNYANDIELFLDQFKVRELLHKHGLDLSKVFFCLQHTRILDRKRIDFALEYAFALFDRLKKHRKSTTEAFYFLVSGHSADKSKRGLKALHKKLSKQYGTDKFFLVFAEECKQTDIKFELFPLIFAKLKGVSTYFSEIEGFGNNLLEVLASGLIPIVYTYPVFKKDIAKYGFKLVALDEFKVEQCDIDKTVDLILRDHKRKIWVNRNLAILKKHFPHRIIAFKLKRAIIRRRAHS